MGIFFQNVHLPSIIVPYNRKIVAWNWPNTITIWWALWMLMAWYFNIWTSVATAWSTHPCVFMCIGVKKKSTCIQKRIYCTTENEVTLTNFIQETPLVLNHRKKREPCGEYTDNHYENNRLTRRIKHSEHICAALGDGSRHVWIAFTYVVGTIL